VLEEKLAGVQCFRLEGRAVGRDEPPMSDLAAQQVDKAKGREVFADSWVGEIGSVRKDEPDTVVFGLLWTVTQHENDLISNINGEAGKHGPHFGLERREGFNDEGIRGRFALGFGRGDDRAGSGHNERIAGKISLDSEYARDGPIRVGIPGGGPETHSESARAVSEYLHR
jgi:hypothetical protein